MSPPGIGDPDHAEELPGRDIDHDPIPGHPLWAILGGESRDPDTGSPAEHRGHLGPLLGPLEPRGLVALGCGLSFRPEGVPPSFPVRVEPLLLTDEPGEPSMLDPTIDPGGVHRPFDPCDRAAPGD